MVQLAAEQPGFLGISQRGRALASRFRIGDLESIKQWKANAEHLVAQKLGREQWYTSFRVRIAKVERDYGF